MTTEYPANVITIALSRDRYVSKVVRSTAVIPTVRSDRMLRQYVEISSPVFDDGFSVVSFSEERPAVEISPRNPFLKGNQVYLGRLG